MGVGLGGGIVCEAQGLAGARLEKWKAHMVHDAGGDFTRAGAWPARNQRVL